MTDSAPLAMPRLIYGTAWKKDATASLVTQALQAGFRGVDTACQPKHYNEPGVGEGIAAFLRLGTVSRSDLYVQTKFTSVDGQDPKRVPYDRQLPLREQVLESCGVSRRNLGVDVLDCLVLHSPMRTLDQTLTVWSAFEELVSRGWVRSLGLSNCYNIATLRAVWERAHVKPSVLQNRLYRDTGYDVELRRYCDARAMVYQSFWTLSANPHLLEGRELRRIAERHELTAAQAFYRCLTQIGIVPLVGTTSALHMTQDLAIFDKDLSDAEVRTVVDSMK